MSKVLRTFKGGYFFSRDYLAARVKERTNTENTDKK
jgi:hypothetical protein